MDRRISHNSAARFLKEATRFEVIWVDEALHQSALMRYESNRRRVSFVDCVSFVVMEQESIERAFCFDEDFQLEGFEIFSS